MGDVKPCLKGWQRVRQLPGLHLKKDLFSTCPNPPSSMGMSALQSLAHTTMLCRQPVSKVCSHSAASLLALLCCAFSCSGVEACRDGNIGEN